MLIYLALAGILGILVFYLSRTRLPDSLEPQGPIAQIPPVKPSSDIWTIVRVKALIIQKSFELGYSKPNLAIAICNQESSFKVSAFNPEVSSSRGDQPDSIGLMGLQFKTAKSFLPHLKSEAELFDPETNVTAGIYYLMYLEHKWFSKYGIDGVIQMYNLGEPRFLNGARSLNYLSSVKRYAGI